MTFRISSSFTPAQVASPRSAQAAVPQQQQQPAPEQAHVRSRFEDAFVAEAKTHAGARLPALFSPPAPVLLQQALPMDTPPDVEVLIEQMSELRARNNVPPLTEPELADLRRLGANELRLYEFALGELEKVAAGTLDPAGYMFSVMDEAARIAGDDTSQFRHLVTFAFASKPGNWEQNLAGRHGHTAGSTIEETLMKLSRDRAAASEGFSPSVTDNLDPHGSTVTHHFGAYIELAQGIFGGAGIQLAHDANGDTGVNPGDVRNGNFGAMVGFAMRWNNMSPTDLASLVRWAYSGDSETSQPWGMPATDAAGNPVPFGDDASHFELAKWVELYNQAHPDAPISMR